ncbi:WXG100 family type VII secretion target [Paenibacillus lemnae]|uniref:WXG100 family type VII secretion target n=1 Tax=Paenibacillus lemnae TaxID=1330551 RepID=A0A848M1C7_PAELE|nr:WXG100 family type VII secretion target [Paenibacillus lemnae]NMO94738.1 WXG100 family type VII secretion target [Paenibacillus lemnae]
MTIIKITPEQVNVVSQQFDRSSKCISQMNNQLVKQISILESLWDGTTKQRFYFDFYVAKEKMELFVSLASSISLELSQIATKFREVDRQSLGNIDLACLPPPPNACPAPTIDTRSGFEKSVDSLEELGRGIMDASNERYNNRYSSIWGFLDYWTAGIPKGAYQGYTERADKLFDSPNDFANGMTFGVHGTIRESIIPKNAWSPEHFTNMIGAAGLVTGGVTGSLIKPKNVLSLPVKYEGVSDLRQISSGGLRNEIPLTDGQIAEIVDFTKILNFPEDNIIVSKPGFYDEWNTGMMYDRFIINTDVFPAEQTGIGTLTANSRVTGRATTAHEIIGHYESYMAGRAFEIYNVDPITFKRNFALDEAQASIRAARFAPDLTSTERMTLLRDAITRLKNADLSIRVVRNELYINER